MKFTYKLGFWILFILSLMLAIYQFGKTTSLEVDLAFRKMHMSFLKSDSQAIGELTTNRLYNKKAIKDFLNKNYYTSDGVRSEGDTLFLDSSYLLFEGDSLTSIIVH